MTPETGNGWFPKLFADGRIVCGLTRIFIGPNNAPFSQPSKWTDLGPGMGPLPIAPDAVLFGEGGDSQRMFIATPSTSARALLVKPDGTPRPGYNHAVASNVGRWFGNRPDGAHDEFQGGTMVMSYGANYHFASVSSDGMQVAHWDRPQADLKSLFVNNALIAKDKAIAECSVSNAYVCWREGQAIYGRRQMGPREHWGVVEFEGGIKLFEALNGVTWLRTNTPDGDLLIRPAGSIFGYRLVGEFPHGDIGFIPDGRICVVASTPQGVITIHHIDPASPRVDLSVPPTPIPPIPPEPPVPPVPSNGLLKPGQKLTADIPLTSQDGRFRLLYQLDGNLVVYGPEGPMWATGTFGTSIGSCDLQGDGNFVLYNATMTPLWASGTNGHAMSVLLMQNDGNAVIYTPQGKPVWSTGTVYVPPPTPPGPPIVRPVPLTVDGLVLRRPDGAIHPVIAESDFLLLRRLLEEGEGIVRAYMLWWQALGYNELRVFSRVDWFGNPGPGLFPDWYPHYWPALNRLFVLAAESGLYVEIVALTGNIKDSNGHVDLNAMADWVNRIEQERRKHVNVFLEVCNEPPVNGVDIVALMAKLDTSSWSQPWSTGQYDPTAEPAGSACTVHTDRVAGWEWVRKGKDVYEYREGGGPQNPSDPAMNRPIKADEPMGADQVEINGRRDNQPLRFYTYAALVQLLGAGGCCHRQSGLTSQMPTGRELECVKAFSAGAKAVGPNWQLGEYSRPGLDHCPVAADPTLRTYVMRVGNTAKVVRVDVQGAGPTLAAGWREVKRDAHSIVIDLVRL